MTGDQRVYRVRAVPWEYGYELHVEGVGVTQTHRDYKQTAEEMSRDLLASVLGGEPDDYQVRVEYTPAASTEI